MDAAALSLKIDSSSVVTAANDLDRFSASAERAGKSAANQSGSIAKLVASAASMDAKLSTLISGIDKMNTGLSAMANAGGKAAAANDNVSRSLGVADNHVIAYTQHLAGLARAQQDANAHVLAYRSSLAASTPALAQADAHVMAYRNSLSQVEEGARKASTAIKFTAQDSLNASRQLADIGVTAAMGMSPFMIAIQQGPQLLDILQNKAAMTGQTIGAVFKAAGAAILAAIAPLLPVILPIIGVLALATAAVAALDRQASNDSGLKKYTTSMGYTKEEVAKLNAVTVTFGDTAKAIFEVGFERIAAALGISTKGMAKFWKGFLNDIASATRATLAGIYAGFAALTQLAPQKVAESLVKGENPFAGVKQQFTKSYADAQKVMDDVVKRTRGNALKRQSDMAKGFYDKPGGGKSAGQSNAEKLADIYASAQADISVEKTRALALASGAGAEEAARLEKQTALLNAVQQKGIPITEAIRAKVAALADEYARLKIGNDVTAAINATTDDIEKQRAVVADQTKLVGLYGDALARATREMDAQRKLRDSLPKDEIVVAPNLTRKLSDDIEARDRLARSKTLERDAQLAAYAMDLEAKGIGLTNEAAIAYAYTVDRLIEAKRAGIDLAPEEVAAIDAAGEAYARQRYAIDQQAQALADAREVTKGFFSDWINGARNGANVFTAFADAAVNALNRIINKLLDKGLETLMNSLFSSGGSIPGFGTVTFANGGSFGTPNRFANGGAFTNSIVTSPTLFRFANGGQLGEMGEAGPEAIMPLKRGPNGSLGVQMHGGVRPAIRMGDVHNTYQVSGAIDQSAIVAMVRQGGEATYNQVKRDLQTLLHQLDSDGSFAS